MIPTLCPAHLCLDRWTLQAAQKSEKEIRRFPFPAFLPRCRAKRLVCKEVQLRYSACRTVGCATMHYVQLFFRSYSRVIYRAARIVNIHPDTAGRGNG